MNIYDKVAAIKAIKLVRVRENKVYLVVS